MADHIPNDLLIEILARLPVASLLRFKSACKSWYSLITSSSFVNKHLNQSITNSERKLLLRLYDYKKERYLLLNDDDKFGHEFTELVLPFEALVQYFWVVGSCNGLLCVVDKLRVIIWNPSTRKSVTLPVDPNQKPMRTCVYGFGAHPATQEYKLIRILHEIVDEYDQLKLPPKVEIYTQGRRSWEGISSAAPAYGLYVWSQAFVDGAVHWVANEPCVGGDDRSLIVSFNMASESFSEFKLPPTLAYSPPTFISIKTLGQSLAVLYGGQLDIDCDSCCIWVMKEYGVEESWTKLLISFNLLGMPNRTLGFRKNGDEVLVASDDSFASYAPGTNTLATTGIKGNSHAFYVEPFMQTLVFV